MDYSVEATPEGKTPEAARIEEAERNFTFLDEAPQEGNPIQEEQDTGFYEGKYKSKEDFEVAHKSLESKLGEQADEIKERDNIIATLKQQNQAEKERARSQFEQFQAQNQTQAPNTKDQFVEQFDEDGNKVYDAVLKTTEDVVNKTVNPLLNKIEQQSLRSDQMNYQFGYNNFISSDPKNAELMPDIVKVGNQLATMLNNQMVAAGMNENARVGVLNKFKYDPNVLPILKNIVVGNKGADYWADSLESKNNKIAEDDADKASLSGGEASPDSDISEMSQAEFDKLSLDEQKKYLKSIGAL